MTHRTLTPSPLCALPLARALGAPVLAGFGLLLTLEVFAEQSKRYSIAAGSLTEVLGTFAASAGITLPIDETLTADLSSPGLNGELTTAQGFNQLLRGTGLEAVPQTGSTYILKRRPRSSGVELDTLQIEGHHDAQSMAIGITEGYRVARSTVGTKTDTALRDIPQSIQVVPRQVLEDQQATSLADAVSNVSSIQRGNTHGGTVESFFMRGFQATTYAIGGVLTNSLVVRPEILTDLVNVERVEVLKGPASVLYGRGNPGGLINIVTRRPSFVPEGQVKLQAGYYDYQRGQAWVSGPLSEKNGLAGSLAMAYQTKGSFREHYRDTHRRHVAPTLFWAPSEVTRVEMGLEYTETDSPYDRGLQIIGDRIDSRHKIFLDEPWSHASSDKEAAWLKVEHDANDWLTLRQVTRWDHSTKDMLNISQRALQADGRTITRRATDFDEAIYSLSTQYEALMRFTTGGLQHNALVGLEAVNGKRNVTMLRANLASIDLYNPVLGAQPGPFTFGEDSRFEQSSYGVYLQDQIDLSEQWKLLLSVRWDKVDQRNRNYAVNGSYADVDIDPSDTSPRVGVVYQPTDRLSLYASYSTSFAPQSRLTRDSTVLDPETGKQYEVGAKYDIIPDRLSGTLSAFEITRENLATTDPIDTAYSIQTGEQRVRGLELDVSGNIQDGWNVIGNIALLDAKLTKDSRLEEGARLEGVPIVSGSIWSTYQLQEGQLRGLGFGGGVFYAGKRYGDLANSYSASGYARTDLTVFYDLNKNVRLSLNARNIFDRDYMETVASAGNYAGEPASVIATVAAGF
ncbi:TonB-dependent receptor [Pseudomonas syringae]|uniref:TonB-dependent siderophore receptor n=1 Tax=Pseudomonas syringae TaxID=317 RepID=UPI00215B696D|nr:TonB-dependent receptor [Pseudomonas syringae]MCR8718247.1 TonB-dependent receptor [Pseudomonas syringae]